MLINAMMTRMDRENMIEFKGMGVPMVVTFDEVSMIEPTHVSCKRRDQPCGTMRRRARLDLWPKTMLGETQQQVRSKKCRH